MIRVANAKAAIVPGGIRKDVLHVLTDWEFSFMHLMVLHYQKEAVAVSAINSNQKSL